MKFLVKTIKNLVLPTSGYELDREEMSYVEGGAFIGAEIYVSNATIYNIAKSFTHGVGNAIASVGGFATALSLGWSAFCAMWAWCPPITVALAVLGALAIGTIATVMATAYFQGKGIYVKAGVEIKWFSVKGVFDFGIR